MKSIETENVSGKYALSTANNFVSYYRSEKTTDTHATSYAYKPVYNVELPPPSPPPVKPACDPVLTVV